MKDSIFQNCCKVLPASDYIMLTVSQVAKLAHVSKKTAQQFFEICEKSNDIFVEDNNGALRRLYAARSWFGEELLMCGLLTFTDYELKETDVIIRRGES